MLKKLFFPLSFIAVLLLLTGCEDKEKAYRIAEFESKIRQLQLEVDSLKESNEMHVSHINKLEKELSAQKRKRKAVLKKKAVKKVVSKVVGKKKVAKVTKKVMKKKPKTKSAARKAAKKA